METKALPVECTVELDAGNITHAIPEAMNGEPFTRRCNLNHGWSGIALHFVILAELMCCDGVRYQAATTRRWTISSFTCTRKWFTTSHSSNLLVIRRVGCTRRDQAQCWVGCTARIECFRTRGCGGVPRHYMQRYLGVHPFYTFQLKEPKVL